MKITPQPTEVPSGPLPAPPARLWLRGQLLERGWDDRAIRRQVARGRLHRVRHGSYVDADEWHALSDADQYRMHIRAVTTRAKCALAVSHVSAVAEWGGPSWGQELGEVHVSRIDMRSGRREAGVRQHCGTLAASDVVSGSGLPVTSATRTCLDTIRTCPSEVALCVVNHFLCEGLTTLELPAERYRGLADAAPMTHWPGSLATDVVLTLADPRIESVGESRLLHLCWCHGIPLPTPQLEVRDSRGRLIGRVDFAWPHLKVFVEFDGREKYQRWLREGETATDVVLREKRREERIVEATGWRCVRVNWADLQHPERTVARLREAFAAAA